MSVTNTENKHWQLLEDDENEYVKTSIMHSKDKWDDDDDFHDGWSEKNSDEDDWSEFVDFDCQ